MSPTATGFAAGLVVLMLVVSSVGPAAARSAEGTIALPGGTPAPDESNPPFKLPGEAWESGGVSLTLSAATITQGYLSLGFVLRNETRNTLYYQNLSVVAIDSRGVKHDKNESEGGMVAPTLVLSAMAEYHWNDLRFIGGTDDPAIDWVGVVASIGPFNNVNWHIPVYHQFLMFLDK